MIHMKEKILFGVVIFVTYLILMLPVSYAQSTASLTEKSNTEKENPNTAGDVISGLMIAVPSLLADFFKIIEMVITKFIENVLPSVNGQYECYPNGCPDSVNYYCDFETESDPNAECRLRSLIDLSAVTISPISFERCDVSHEAKVNFKIDFAPRGLKSIDNPQLNLGNGVGARPLTSCVMEEETSEYRKYSCDVTIPSLGANCQQGGAIIEGNTLTMEIDFNNVPAGISHKENLEGSTHSLILTSATCGDGNYQQDWNENCCYESSCPSSTEFCDLSVDDRYAGDYLQGSCQALVKDTDLVVKGASRSFDHHDSLTGDLVEFNYQISNKPASWIAAENELCSIACSTPGETCTATCSVASCSEAASSSTSIYNSTCYLRFYISDHDQAKTYTLRPTFNISIRYYNSSFSDPTAIITENLRETQYPFLIQVSGSTCGNSQAEYGETASNCCIDVACPSEYYCDWIDGSAGTNRCKADNLNIEVESLEEAELTTTRVMGPVQYEGGFAYQPVVTVPVSTEFKVKVENIPDTIDWNSLQTACNFNEPEYSFDCRAVPGTRDDVGDDIFLTYELQIPAINLEKTSYLVSPDQVMLTTNTIDLSISFRDRGQTVTRSFTDDIPPIIINIENSCGNGIDESDTGEGQCCVLEEIPCGDGLQCIGTQDSNACVDPTEMNLIVDVPDQSCIIRTANGKCNLNEFYFGVAIYAPEGVLPDDLELIGGFYIFDPDEGPQTPYAPVEIYQRTLSKDSCSELEVNSINDFKQYGCSITLPPINYSTEGVGRHSLNLTVDVSYDQGNQRETLNRLDDFNVRRTQIDELKSCQERVDEFDGLKVTMERMHPHFDDLAKFFFYLAISCGVGCAIFAFVFKPLAAYFFCPLALLSGIASCIYAGTGPDNNDNVYNEHVRRVEETRDKFEETCGSYGVHLTIDEQNDKLDDLWSNFNADYSYQDADVEAEKWGKLMGVGCLVGVSTSLAFGPGAIGAATSSAAPAGAPAAGTSGGSALGDYVPSAVTNG
ncbi:MAG: hypothetical protein ABIJ92_00140 [Candidatus Aenigmatarchaeota archaeon]